MYIIKKAIFMPKEMLMRHRIMYFIAFIVAGAFAFIFKGNVGIERTVEILSVISIIFGLSVTLLFISSSIVGAAAGLRRVKKYGSTIGKSLLWSVVATAASVFLVFLLGKLNLLGLNKVNFDVLDIKSSNMILSISELFKMGLSIKSFMMIISIGVFFMMLTKLFVGYHLKPSTKVLRPAYLFYASYTELSYRIARAMCDVYMVLLLFITSNFFFKIIGSNGNKVFFEQTKSLAIVLSIVTLVMIVIVLPVLFSLFSGFKKNPISAMWTAFVNSLVAMFTGSALFAFTPINVTHRFECYLPKKTTSVSSTVLLIFSRVGSAVVACIAILFATKGLALGITANIMIALLCIIFSFVSSMTTGFEVLLIVGLVSSVLNLEGDLVMKTSLLLPLLNIFAAFIDTYAISLGSNSVSGKIALKKA